MVRRLAASADVFVHSLKPGSAEARGLGYDDLADPGTAAAAREL